MVRISNFTKIKTPGELIRYLEESSRDKEFFYHYTTIDRLNLIFEKGYFVFSGFEHMNDISEADALDDEFSRNAFVGSFSRAENEVMAMWGMYAIPWEMGVRIGIPKPQFRQWIKETHAVYALKWHETETEVILSTIQKKINAVCYYDPKNHRLDWSNRRLYLRKLKELQNPDTIPELNGYLKHKAWSTEEEIRVLLKVKTDKPLSRIAVKIPDYVLDNIHVVLGPCFNQFELIKENMVFSKSEFSGKVIPKEKCSLCGHNFTYSPHGLKFHTKDHEGSTHDQQRDDSTKANI